MFLPSKRIGGGGVGEYVSSHNKMKINKGVLPSARVCTENEENAGRADKNSKTGRKYIHGSVRRSAKYISNPIWEQCKIYKRSTAVVRHSTGLSVLHLHGESL